MKGILLKILVIVMAICSALCVFTACSEGDNGLHNHVFVDFTIEPTCTTGGYVLHKCACGEEYKDGYTDAKGHKYQSGKCVACGVDDPNYSEPIESVHTHEFIPTVISATCSLVGYTLHKCACGEEYTTDEKPALGHNYEWIITQEPTETENGLKTGVCTRCGDTIIGSIPKLNHEHNYIITVKEPTCSSVGYILHKCACGEEYTTDETPALGHNYEWIITQEPTETENGLKTDVCTRCGDTIIGSIPKLNHEHNYIITVKEPTCTQKGYTTHTCSHCQDSYIDTYTDELGHEFTNYAYDNNATYDEDGTKTAVCNRGCGATNTVTAEDTKLKSEIVFKTLSVDEKLNVYGKVANTKTTFSFINEVEIKGNATFVVSTDIYGMQQIPTKTVPIEIGDNTFYITETVGNNIRLFTITVRRRPIHTVTFNTDGGSTVAPQHIEEDSFATEPKAPTKTGYTFDGWDYDFNTPITDRTVIKTQWNYYTLTTIVNDDSAGSVTMHNQTKITVGESISITAITNTSYTFVGWYNGDKELTKELSYFFTMPSENIIYTAKWCKVILSENDSNAGSVSMLTGKYKTGETVTVTATTNDGYTFIGWFNGEKELTNASRYTFTMPSESVTYTAKWQINTYKIKYNANGGTDAPSTQTKTTGQIITLSDTVPINGDRVFMGWQCAYDGNTYDTGANFNIDANVTMYAVWGHVCKTCGGSGTEDTRATCSNCGGTGRSLDWVYCDVCNGTGELPCRCKYCGNTTRLHIGNNEYVCAECSRYWGKISTCYRCKGTRGSVDYDHCSVCGDTGKVGSIHTCPTCNGNKYIEDTHTQYSVFLYVDNQIIEEFKVGYSCAYRLTVPVRNGYSFIGWFDSQEGGNQYTDCYGVCLNNWVEKDGKSLYAQWLLNYYTITYDCDESVDLTGLPTTYTIEDDNIALKELTKANYDFVGWQTNAESDGLIISNGIITGIGICTDTVLCLDHPISASAFAQNTRFNTVYLMDGCTQIGEQAFFKCTNLTTVYCLSSIAPVFGNDVFGYAWDSSSFKVYVPVGSYSLYVNASSNNSEWQTNIVNKGKLIEKNVETKNVSISVIDTSIAKDLTLIPVWELTQYFISLDFNGGVVQSNQIPDDAKLYNGHYYYFYSGTKTWEDAKLYCENLGGHLATVTDAAEDTWITSNIGTKYYWLGGFRDGSEWKWVTGEIWSFTNWNSGEPNNYGGVEDKLGYQRNQKWNDYPNVGDNNDNTVVGFVCEWETSDLIGIENTINYTVETETFNLPTPIKDGYEFIGWTGSNGTIPQLNVVIGKGSGGNRIYIANWQEIVS